MSKHQSDDSLLTRGHDLVLVDHSQARMFGAVGKRRGLFEGADKYPWLHKVLDDTSANVLEDHGEEYWRELGGRYDKDDGHPTCYKNSKIAEAVIHDVADKVGGVLWIDNWGRGWAVRLTPGSGSVRYYGFAFTWGNGPVQEKADYAQTVLDDCRQRHPEEKLGDLHRIVNQLRLYERAEQLLWVIHAAVIKQRCSSVLLPDYGLGEVVWGGDRSQWPKAWRRELMQTLGALTYLRAELLVLRKKGWQPGQASVSVAVASVVDLAAEYDEDDPRHNPDPHRDRCTQACPAYGENRPHSHFLVQIGLGFLGVLERCAIARGESDADVRRYNFGGDPKKQLLKPSTGETREKEKSGDGSKQSKKLGEARKTGQVRGVCLPARILGGAAWAKLPRQERDILDGLINETTRRRQSRRQDQGGVQQGDVVVDATGTAQLHCPLLREHGRYIVFGGNGKRRGCGYKIVGKEGRGWLYKCGYQIPILNPQRRKLARAFLSDLAGLASKLGLVVAGLEPGANNWWDLQALQKMTTSKQGYERLQRVHLRVYAPEDYLNRLREYLADRGGFIGGVVGREEAEGGEPQEGVMASPADMPMATRIKDAGLRQGDVAERLGISRSHLVNLLNGRKRWSEALFQRCEQIVGEAGC